MEGGEFEKPSTCEKKSQIWGIWENSVYLEEGVYTVIS